MLSLALIVFSLAVHGAETLMDRKRAIASLAAAAPPNSTSFARNGGRSVSSPSR